MHLKSIIIRISTFRTRVYGKAWAGITTANTNTGFKQYSWLCLYFVMPESWKKWIAHPYGRHCVKIKHNTVQELGHNPPTCNWDIVQTIIPLPVDHSVIPVQANIVTKNLGTAVFIINERTGYKENGSPFVFILCLFVVLLWTIVLFMIKCHLLLCTKDSNEWLNFELLKIICDFCLFYGDNSTFVVPDRGFEYQKTGILRSACKLFGKCVRLKTILLN